MNSKTKILIGVLVIVIIFIVGGWLFSKYKAASFSNCSFYRLIITGECVCPEGYENLGGFMPYCATESLKPCSFHTDCPENERCISKDGKNWFCSGRRGGCYHWNPENPEEFLCAD